MGHRVETCRKKSRLNQIIVDSPTNRVVYLRQKENSSDFSEEESLDEDEQAAGLMTVIIDGGKGKRRHLLAMKRTAGGEPMQ